MNYFFTSLIILLFWYVPAQGQFTDDFSDGDLQGWEGNVDHFIVNSSFRLQLMAPEGSTNSWIHISPDFTDSMSWDLQFTLDFAPSTSNQLRIYLGLSSPDLATATGYFLEIGASGDTDALEFKFLDAGSITSLASSAAGIVASEPVQMSLHVTKNENGLWEFYDYTGIIPVLLFSTPDDAIPLSSLQTFGFYTKYTDTRRDKFSFDNIFIDALTADLTPPQWLSLEVTDSEHLSLVFDEALDEVISSDPEHYVLTPGEVSPSSASVSGNQVSLTWSVPFVSLQSYTLTVQGVSDLSGNVATADSRNFVFTQIDQASAYDLLITEIMADPSPPVALPDAEYFEIFNASNKLFDLSDYTVTVGTSVRSLPDSLILPGEYVIVTDDANASLFAGFGKIIVVESFSTLTNSGATLSLKDQGNQIIHEVSYTDAWYQDESKSDGGWSLEMKNPFHICTGITNWSAPENLTGGTPGAQNTGWSQDPDTDGPVLLSLFVASPQIIELRFNEKLDDLLVLDPLLYGFQPDLAIDHVELFTPSSVRLHLSTGLSEGVIYSMTGVESFDCIGNNKSTDTSIVFGISSIAIAGDIIINEILFNPATGGSRFIEILNRSDKFIQLSSLSVGKINADDQDIFPTGLQEIMAPGALIVLTPDRQDILSRYSVPNPSQLFEASLPSWDDQADNVSILSGGLVIDSFTYSSSWHHPVISDENGVSLERVSATSPSTSASNWHSASSLSGYATPTGVNSQNVHVQAAEPPFTITNKHFSPDDDGFNDFLLLSFEQDPGNDVGSIWVYDLEGREIHQVLSNETIGNGGIVQWDGRNAEGVLADMGIYVIFVELWDPDGNVRRYKETCALVKRP